MDTLPKCLFKEGTETQVDKVNNCCRTSILELAKDSIEAEYNDVLDDPVFGQIVAIAEHELGFSGTVIHSFVCKQLLTSKRHELWFRFARRPLRFSMQEFYAITGLKYKEEPELEDDESWTNDKGFWGTLLRRKKKICLQQIRNVHLKSCNKWSHVDRLRLVYLCVIAGMVLAKDEKVWIPHKYIRLVMDFEKMRNYPWGLHSFDMLVSSVIHARNKVKTQNSYVINGLSYALQIWLMEAIPDIGSLLGRKLTEGVTSMRCRNWKGSAKVSYEEIISIESDFGSNGIVFPFLSSTGNYDIIVHEDFGRISEMNDERVDLIIDMYRKKHDWSKQEWAYKETAKQFESSSAGDASEQENDGETSELGEEEEVQSTPVSAKRKEKRKFKDVGAESRKRRLLCQRSAEKYRDIEGEMKSYINSLFKSSFTGLEEKVVETMDERFTRFEEKFLSLIRTHGDAPAVAFTETPPPPAAAFTTPSGSTAPAAPTAPTPAPTKTPAPAPSRKGATASRKGATASTQTPAGAPSTTCGPATAAKTRSQSKDVPLADSFGSLFGSLDERLGTQEDLQKTMGNLTQESTVRGFDPPEDYTTPMTSFRPHHSKTPCLRDIDLPETRAKDSDYALVFVPEEKWSKLTAWSLDPKPLQIGPSNYDLALSQRVIGPGKWFKNYEMDAMMYLFQEKTSLRRWKPDRVAFMTCLFSMQLTKTYSKFLGSKRGFRVDDCLLSYGVGEQPYHGKTGAVWYVDVERLYIPVNLKDIHWISLCVNLVNRHIDVFDCGGMKNHKVVEAFAVLIPRIVKAVQPAEMRKHFNVTQYSVSYVPMPCLNKTNCDCGAYALKFIECHVLGLPLTLVNDENIQEARHKIAYDLWEAANDEVLQYRMTSLKPPVRVPEKPVEV